MIVNLDSEPCGQALDGIVRLQGKSVFGTRGEHPITFSDAKRR